MRLRAERHDDGDIVRLRRHDAVTDELTRTSSSACAVSIRSSRTSTTPPRRTTPSIIIALAVEIARTDGIEYASEINGVTRDGTKCTSFAECRDLIAAGEDIDYDGISGPLEFDGNGEPTHASYGLLRMGDNNRIDPTLTEFIAVEGEAGSSPRTSRSRAPARVMACLTIG